MCRQALATAGSQRTPVRFISPSLPALGNRPSPAHLSDICSRFISGSLLPWRISDCAAPFLGKGQQPVLVEPRCDLVRRPSIRRGILPPTRLSTASFMLWMRHLLSPEDLRKRKERLRNLRRETPERQHKKEQSKRQRRPRRYRDGVRTDSGPVALQGFWGMHAEATNFSGMGHAEYAAAPRPFAARAADLARSSGTIRQRNGLAQPASSECPAAIKQRC